MSRYRRARVRGAVYFFTVVTFDRRPILTRPEVRAVLQAAWRKTRSERPFETVALVLLPDHLHCVWRLPDGDGDFGTRWRLIKTRATRALVATGWRVAAPSPQRARRRERDVWQRRFWEHLIRDDEDLRRHVEYTHYNPVRHGLAPRPVDWPFSTFHRYVRRGVYEPTWGTVEPALLCNWDGARE